MSSSSAAATRPRTASAPPSARARCRYTQLDIRPVPPLKEDKLAVWPYWPTKFRTSSSQAEGAEREFAAATLGIEGKNGKVTAVKCARVDAKRQPIAGTEFLIKADLVFIALGFVHPVHDEGMLEQEGLAIDKRGNVAATDLDYATSVSKGLRGRRHAPRPVSRGVGDPRGPSGGAVDRHFPDGQLRPAALRAVLPERKAGPRARLFRVRTG